MPVIVGVPRSGTTLLRLMLDAHSELAIPPETYFLFKVVKLSRAGELRTADQLCSLVTSTDVWDDFGLSKDPYLERVRELAPFSVSDGLRAFYQLYAERCQKARWGDKTPRYSLILQSIERLLPEARFIHVVRDGRDVALSLRDTWFAPAQDVAEIAQYWKYQVEHARAVGARCRFYREVRYEDLVHTTTDTLEQICDFIELPYEAGMESYHRSAERRLSDLNAHHYRDGSVKVSREDRLHIHRFSKQPPDPTRIGRWRQDMREEERLTFEHVAGDLLQQLGYAR